MKRAAALLALAVLTGCSATGPQSVGVHEDVKPPGVVRVAAADVAGESVCYGDGQSGKRVQAVYVVAADRTDQYATIAPQIRTWTANLDDALDDSAAKRGGRAHVRWACSGGVIDVGHLVVSPTGDDSWTTTNARDQLRAAGLNRSDRKYVTWTDATQYCGIAETESVTSAETTTGLARIDTTCWGLSAPAELHELAHTLGAVQPGAVGADGAWHCVDGQDRMCYPEENTKCPNAERLLDCGNDSYFDAAAVANPMPINLADSGFLEVLRGGATPDPTDSPSPTPTATSPSPTPTATATTSPTPTPTATAPKPCGKSHRPGCR